MEEICVVNLHEPVYCEIVIIPGATLIDYFNVYVVSNEPMITYNIFRKIE